MRKCKVCHQEKELHEYYFFKDKGYGTTCDKCSCKLQRIKNKWKARRLHILDALKTHGNDPNSTNNEKNIDSYVMESKSQNRYV